LRIKKKIAILKIYQIKKRSMKKKAHNAHMQLLAGSTKKEGAAKKNGKTGDVKDLNQ